MVLGVVGVFAYQKYMGTTSNNLFYAGINGPSGGSTVETAAALITHPQTAYKIDNNYAPQHTTQTFTARQKIYLTFEINAPKQKGYVQIRWYKNSKRTDTDSFFHDPVNLKGYFSTSYNTSAQGAAELYWCTQANCRDAQLAQVLHFTVTQ